MNEDELLDMSKDQLQILFSKTNGIVMEMQILVGTPSHQLEIGFMENLLTTVDQNVLR